MPKQQKKQKKSDSPSSAVKPLPKSRETLGLMLRSTEGMLAFLEPYVGAQETRLRHLEKTLRRPPQTPTELRDFLERAEFLKEVTKATRSRFAQGGPSWTALRPYLESSGLDTVIERQRWAAGRMRALTPENQTRFDPEHWKQCVAAFVELVAAERAIIELISDLQNRIVAALDETERTRADTPADTKSKGRVRLPQNPQVLALVKMINDNLDHERSQNDIAIQFTEGDEKRARSLLRQARRYRDVFPKRQK